VGVKAGFAVEDRNNEIRYISGWGTAPGAPKVVRFLQGPQKRLEDLRTSAEALEEMNGGVLSRINGRNYKS
jgi:hypothetical protein